MAVVGNAKSARLTIKTVLLEEYGYYGYGFYVTMRGSRYAVAGFWAVES